MENYQGGWNDLALSNPIPITDIIAYASFGATGGTIKYSTNYHLPTGTWGTPPANLISGPPLLSAVNSATNPEEAFEANRKNQQNQMVNLNAPPAVKNIAFLYGNSEGLKFLTTIPMNLGADSFTSIQISILENAATSGIDQSGKIQVFDFGAGPFTGNISLALIFANYIGEVHIGIRLYDSTSNQTSIYDLRVVILSIEPNDKINMNMQQLNVGISTQGGKIENETIKQTPTAIVVAACPMEQDGTKVAICGCIRQLPPPKVV